MLGKLDLLGKKSVNMCSKMRNNFLFSMCQLKRQASAGKYCA